jgi:hypothetical protein
MEAVHQRDAVVQARMQGWNSEDEYAEKHQAVEDGQV